MTLYQSFQFSEEPYFHHQVDMGMCFPEHLHRNFELLMVNKGEMLCIVDGRSFPLTVGDFILILPNEIHSYQADKDTETLLWIFSGSYISDFYAQVQGKRLCSPVFRIPGTEKICRALSEDNQTFYFRKALLYLVCDSISRQTDLEETETKSNELMVQIIHYVEKNFKYNINLKGMAEELKYNYSYLSSYFNQHFQVNFNDFLNQYRIEEAMEFLEQSRLSIGEIAALCGYNSVRSFNRAFQKITEITPSQYRAAVIGGRTHIEKSQPDSLEQ